MLTFGLANPLGALAPVDFKTSISRLPTTPIINAEVLQPVQPQPGECRMDESGKPAFIWKISPEGTGYWSRLRVGETCATVGTGPAPTVRDHQAGSENYVPQGGVSVTTTPSYRTKEAELRKMLLLRDIESIQRLIAIAPSLPQCPDSSVSDRGCYQPQPPLLTFGDLLLPPGSFTYYGVPFHVSELNAQGRFEKNGFVPTPEQRFQIDMAILARSQYEFRKKDLGFNIQWMLDHDPDMRINVPGFSLNPLTPTEEEMTQMGGAQQWVARGGYFISYNALTGKIPVTGYGDSRGIAINTCASISCACPQDDTKYESWRTADYSQYGVQGGLIPADQHISWFPACKTASVTVDGIIVGKHSADSTWNVFVSMNEANPAEYYMHIVIKPDAWTNKAAGWIGEQLAKLGMLFCDTQPAVQQQLQTSMAEKCVDKQQKPCTKGTPGCTCTKPPQVQQVSVGVFNAWSNHWCSGFTQEHGQQPPPDMPDPNESTPQTPPELEPQGMPWWQWGLIIGAGVGALYMGKTLIARRG